MSSTDARSLRGLSLLTQNPSVPSTKSVAALFSSVLSVFSVANLHYTDGPIDARGSSVQKAPNVP
ncbi:MAG TPA: hypothetical protein PKB10_06365, partial [Tepidisphaeraceae bacterium]|nr:hypothetical protein [Tepidisphaeraceae bacterium]